MPRYLAIELSQTESRVLLARTGSGGTIVEQAFWVPLESEGDKPGAESLEASVVAALAERGIARLPVIGVVGRSEVELRLLNLPPAPEDELPDLVRFQAGREFPSLETDAALDFLPLDDAADQPRRVLAAVLKPGVADRFARICGAAKLSLERLVFHPAAAASLLLRRRPELEAGWCLMMDVLDGQAELAAIRNGRIVFSRHVLLPDGLPDGVEATDAIGAEVRRTRAAAANQEGVPPPELAIVFGHDAPWATMAQRLAQSLGMGVELVDPFAGAATAGALESSRRARFAALVGALTDESENQTPALDFLHPRRRPEPPNRRNAYALAGLAAAAVVLAVMLVSFVQAHRMRKSIEALNNESAALTKLADEADKTVANAEEVGKWVSDDVVWIDEVRWLSENFTPPQEAMLTKLVAAVAAGRAEMRLDGLASNVDAASRLDGQLQDDRHRLLGQTKSEARSDSPYRIQFRSTVQIERTK